MASNLPSSFARATATGEPLPGSVPAQPYTLPQAQPAPKSSSNNLLMIICAISLALSIASLYAAFSIEKPMSANQKEALLGIANDLKDLQNREMVLSAPVSTTIYLNRSYPIKDLFPPTFEMPLSFDIPIDAQVIGISSTGQPVQFTLQESVPISVSVPIDSATAFGDNTIHIEKELPVDARFTSTIKVKAAYGQDLNNLIDKLEKLANSGSG